ncbi:hypothetical protein D3C78_1150270 [compost metagenome]
MVGRAGDPGHHLGGNGDEGHRQARGQVADRRHAQPRGLQGGVELAVADQRHRLGVGQELDLAQVRVGHPGGLENGAGVQLGARAWRADGDALAPEVGQGVDPCLGTGNHLDVVAVGAADGTQVLQRRLEAGIRHAVPGVAHRVAEGEGQLAAPGLQQIEVFHRGLGRLHRGLGAVDVPAIQLRQGGADRVVHPAGAAGEDIDEGRSGEYRRAGQQARRRGEQAQALAQFHGASPCENTALRRSGVTCRRAPAATYSREATAGAVPASAGSARKPGAPRRGSCAACTAASRASGRHPGCGLLGAGN